MTGTEKPEIKIESPSRPFPLGAKKALAEYSQRVVYGESDRTAWVDSVPPESVLVDWELSRREDEDPEEKWRAHGTEIAIYDDRVTEDGAKLGLNPEEAKQKARNKPEFERLE